MLAALLWIDRSFVEDAERWEGIARGMLEEVGADDDVVDPRAVASAYGLRLEPVHTRSACWDGEVIRFPIAVRPARQSGVIAHELGHHGLERFGEPQSERGAALVGAGLLVPRRALDVALRRVGWDYEPLRARFPHASAELLARRIAEVRDALVTIIDGRRIKARVASPGFTAPSRLTQRERAALEDIRAGRELVDDHVRVWHLLEPGYDRVILIADVEQLVGSSRVDLQACKLEYSIVSPK